MKTLVLGLGNSVRADDGVGIYVARALRSQIVSPEVTVMEASVSGLDILELLSGYDRAIIIDAIQTKGSVVGDVCRLDITALQATRHSINPHSADLATSLELGRRLGLPLPGQIVIFGIEIADADSFSEDCTPQVTKAIPVCVNRVMEEIAD